MEKIRILWADDEIDMLKAHVIFLEQKGYEVVSTNNGNEALELIRTEAFDIIFLDENMPGLTGLETLAEINNLKPGIPVVMITKSEEESIMEDAIGGNISDYLIKPVKPNQILLTLKKNLEKRELISQKTTMAYQQAFREIGMEISTSLDYNGWMELYRRIVNWELRLQQTREDGMLEIVRMQKEEANNVFSRYYEDNYPLWLKGKSQEKPVLSHTLIREKLFPLLEKESQLFLIVIDNLRYDQWKTIQPVIEELFRVEKDEMYCSILPTTTQFARNALFAGLMPSE
ncbi:MAG: response regulator, partial [Bacteroidales bacterium]|nr:response regulator [Bacteroidales bacterium]